MSSSDTKFEIDNEKIDEYANYFKGKSEELNNLFKDMLQLCDRVEENYISEDSSVFLEKFRNNIKKMASDNEVLYTGGQTLEKTNSLYTQQENKWAKEVSRFDDDKEVV